MTKERKDTARAIRLQDPMRRSALLATRWAPTLCSAHGHADDCSWYHGAWPMLRGLGVLQGVDGDAEFFREAIAQSARPGQRVLITAAADHAILALVLDAFRSRDALPQVTVVDRCPTALALNRWYGRWNGLRVATARADITEYAAPAGFDLITTHSILSFIPEDLRPRLYANWRALLASGGRLVIAQAVRPQAQEGAVRAFDAEEVERFVARTEQRAQARDIGLPPEQIRELARRFARHKTALSVGSAEAIVAGLEQAGLEIVDLQQQRRAPNYASASPERPDAIINTRIVARAP